MNESCHAREIVCVREMTDSHLTLQHNVISHCNTMTLQHNVTRDSLCERDDCKRDRCDERLHACMCETH